MVPSDGVDITYHPPHLPTNGIARNIPIEAVVTISVVLRVPIAIVIALTAHEQHGCAGHGNVQCPPHACLRPRVPVVASCHRTPDLLHEVAVLSQAPATGLVPSPYSVRIIVEPLVENLVMGTEQVIDRAVGRWVAEAADEILQPIDITATDDAGEVVSTPHIPTGTKANGVEDVVWVAILGVNELVGEGSDQLLHNRSQSACREVHGRVEPEAIYPVLVEPHRGIFDEEPLHVWGILIRTTTESRLHRAKVDATASPRVALVGSTISIAIELPEVMRSIHVVVD